MNWVRASMAVALVALTAQTAGDQIVVQQVMKEVVAPQANFLWDVGNRAMDDNGDADASRVSAADWSKLMSSGRAMKDAATKMAAATKVIVAAPGTKVQDEGASGSLTAAQIQKHVDADRQGFTERSRELAVVSDEFLAAAEAKDAAKLVAASGRLDQVCEACHVKFWYPEQDGGAAAK